MTVKDHEEDGNCAKVVDWNPGKKISVIVGGETKVYKSEAICQVLSWNELLWKSTFL